MWVRGCVCVWLLLPGGGLHGCSLLLDQLLQLILFLHFGHDGFLELLDLSLEEHGFALKVLSGRRDALLDKVARADVDDDALVARDLA